jgi:hypothetical protein
MTIFINFFDLKNLAVDFSFFQHTTTNLSVKLSN